LLLLFGTEFDGGRGFAQSFHRQFVGGFHILKLGGLPCRRP
jgi:hypothetical protein